MIYGTRVCILIWELDEGFLLKYFGKLSFNHRLFGSVKYSHISASVIAPLYTVDMFATQLEHFAYCKWDSSLYHSWGKDFLKP